MFKPSLTDIRPPTNPPAKKKPEGHIPAVNPRKRQRISAQKIAYLISAGLGIAILIYALAIFNFTYAARASFQSIQKEISRLKPSLKNFQMEKITEGAGAINSEIQKLFAKSRRSGTAYLSPLIGPLSDILKNSSLVSGETAGIGNDLVFLQKNGFALVAGGEGEKLIFVLERLKNSLEIIAATNQEIKIQSFNLRPVGKLALLQGLLSDNYQPIQLNLYRTKEFLSGLLALLKSETDQHLLLIFQNPSEMRPAGGFIGSYGDLILNQGNLKELKVDDIYNADRQLDLRIIPPRELQGITKNWGARDANWFFDFPTSAKKVISFLESSELHKKEAVNFAGAIAINTDVLGTILEITGPIHLENYGQTVDGKNFLPIIQYEVEAGRDKKPGQNPKRVLSALMNLVMEKLNQLNDSQKALLSEKIKDHFLNKDLMVYSEDWKIQNFLEEAGVAGDVLLLPENFSGDYLAIVNANIAGGKSDAFIDQHINLKSQVNSGGKIINELTVTKIHSGENQKDWWYRSPNKTYLKILVPENSKLIFLRGNDSPPFKNRDTYSARYQKDADLASIEGQTEISENFQAWIGKEFKKQSFGTWLITPAGEQKTLTLVYETGTQLNLKDGQKYRFIFEKQSGSGSSLEYSLTAPPGYLWKENSQETFDYGTQQIKAREIIELTLKKI